MTYRTTFFVRAVAVLYALTGASMMAAPLLAVRPVGSWTPFAGVVVLGAIVAAAGFGLWRRAGWAWPLAFAIAASGAVVAALRLWAGGAWEGLSATLVTNLLTLAVLLGARRRTAA